MGDNKTPDKPPLRDSQGWISVHKRCKGRKLPPAMRTSRSAPSQIQQSRRSLTSNVRSEERVSISTPVKGVADDKGVGRRLTKGLTMERGESSPRQGGNSSVEAEGDEEDVS